MAREDILTARQGDTVDGLIWRERGLGAGDLAAVLAANPGAAALGTILPIGTSITIPAAAPARASRPVIQLWD